MVQHACLPEVSRAPVRIDVSHDLRALATGIEALEGAWTRRDFLTSGLAPLLLLSARPGWAAGPLPPGPSARDDRHHAPSHRSQSGAAGHVQVARLTTPVYINDHGPYPFLVDTGALRSVLASEVAARLGLTLCPPVLLQGIILARKTAEVQVARLGAGRVTCTDLRLPVLPGTMLRADGYLGLDVLDGHRVVFDFRTNTLRIEASRGFVSTLWTRNEKIRIRAKGDSGRLRSTDCYVNGCHTTAFIDSGAEVSVCNSSLYAALQRHRSPPVPVARVQLSGITGGSLFGNVIIVDAVRLPGLTLSRAPVVIADLPIFALWGLSNTPAMLIGMNCLRAFSSVTIDYGRKTLLFAVRTLDRSP
jgi:hypothetical protein